MSAAELVLVVDPDRKWGRVTIGHTRLTVTAVLELIAAGEPQALIQQAWPDLTDAQFRVLAQLAVDLAPAEEET